MEKWKIYRKKIGITPPKTNERPLKINGWKMYFLLNWSLFRGHSFVFRGVTWFHLKIMVSPSSECSFSGEPCETVGGGEILEIQPQKPNMCREKGTISKGNESSSNHQFSGDMLVSGRVIILVIVGTVG